MKIEVEVVVLEDNALFLKQEVGSGSIGEESLTFGVSLEVFKTILRAIHNEEVLS